MSVIMVLLRVLHIVLGVFWAGTIFFMVAFLQPALRKAGPEGGRLMARLEEQRFFVVMPLAALLTILSGIAMLWRLSAGFRLEWLTTPTGLSLSIGGLAAIIAFGIGITVMRPSAVRLQALARSAGPNGITPEQQLTMARLGRVSMISARWVASLLVVAVTTMAVARYLY